RLGLFPTRASFWLQGYQTRTAAYNLPVSLVHSPPRQVSSGNSGSRVNSLWARMVVAVQFNSGSPSSVASGGFMCYGAVIRSLLALLLFAPLSWAEQTPLPVVVANDNRTPAGNLKDGILNLSLELRQARWYAEAADGVYEDLYAFAEEGHS